MTTRSKLGGQYPTARIQAADKQSHATLKRLRGLAGNRECAECRASPTTWASVSLGVFVCMDCAQVHRNLGAHISKVKSCMGTYLWCPDELDRMREIGNERADALYTGGAAPGTVIRKPAAGASFEERDRYARDKYEARKWMHPGGMAAVRMEVAAACAAAPAAAPARAARREQAGGSNRRARDAARSKVRAMRQAREEPAPEASALLSTADGDDWGGGEEWGEWSAAVPVPAPAAAVATPPTESAFDSFFRECTAEAQAKSAPAKGSSTDLIDLAWSAPSPASSSQQGLLAG